jgi:mycothiol synthase
MEVRPVKREEIEQALRLILTGASSNTTDDDAVLDFLQLSVTRGIDLTGIWVAADRQRLSFAALPMHAPGKTMLIMLPARLRPGVSNQIVVELLGKACLDAEKSGINMAQILVNPEHSAVLRAVQESSFNQVAELLYLAREVSTPIGGRVVPDGHVLTQYDRVTHPRFAQTIERSYLGSMDCPALNGKRNIEDILLGHKHAGEFDPELWYILTDPAGNDVGTLLLSRLHRREGMELVYVGLTPAGRGRGLGDVLMRLAINACHRDGGGQLLCGCDANNIPATKLYHRHGFGMLYSRLALIRELGEPIDFAKTLPKFIDPA